MKGYFTQCDGKCGRTVRLQKPDKWVCDECVAKHRHKTLEIPIIFWQPK
jgi:hypothetical protein